jgi:peptide/nickel transport system permease protein
MREALGLGEPMPMCATWKWLVQFFWVEPLVMIDWVFGTTFSEGMQRVISWQTRSPVMDIVIQRMPQTLWVVGMAYVVGVLIAMPIGIYSAYKQYSVSTRRHLRDDDRLFGAALLLRRSGDRDLRGQLGWFPSIYDTTLVVTTGTASASRSSR